MGVNEENEISRCTCVCMYYNSSITKTSQPLLADLALKKKSFSVMCFVPCLIIIPVLSFDIEVVGTNAAHQGN